jgi:ornithine cyclodeaminase
MLVVDETAAKNLVDIEDAIDVVEKAFLALENEAAEVFQVAQGHGTNAATRFGVKAGLIQENRLIGMKVGSYWTTNRSMGFPNHGSTTLFLDDETGFIQALVSSSYLTALRTAAADAVAVRHLAKPAASSLGIVGTGHQAWFDLLAIRCVRSIRQVLVWNRSHAAAESFAERAQTELGMNAKSVELEDLVRHSDVIATATAAKGPLIQRSWVSAGVHISAMGADGPGKQELSIDLVRDAYLFADIVAQSQTIGEFQSLAHAKLLSPGQIRTLGSVIAGKSPGRFSDNEITIFDSSGIALQDLAIGALALKRAIDTGLVKEVLLD